MNIGSNQQIFEDFQKSVDQAHSLAMKLAPEHFYLAYDRCAKLQKVIFKRACGYCSNSEVNSEFNTIRQEEQMKGPPFNMCYMNLPTMSLCAPLLSFIPTPKITDSSCSEVLLEKLVLLKHHAYTVPSKSEIIELEKCGHVVSKCHLLPLKTVEEFIEHFMTLFQSLADLQPPYELCQTHPEDYRLLTLLQQLDIQSLPPNSTLFLRPSKYTPQSPLSSTHSQLDSPQSTPLNSFIVNNNTDLIKSDSTTLLADNMFPESSYSATEVSTEGTAPKIQRKYNWSVMLTKLHEKVPVSLKHEVLPSPSKCHELHVIPPTTQKLRPTKRCQLCLKGYRSRKESRYYCRACDKGFHIKCFDLYHVNVGCRDFKVKIIAGDH